ncbi:hypothetical protein F5Y16DRAFT_411951 [Xylariaceae sp. FL0255]|nr:hypothetical protein F5Y16DRAFT_411951 [Xylariaceae sp. FL0255]
MGNPYLLTNQSAKIPDHLNTAVWITNLPPDLDHKMLLGHIRNCGKVWAAVVNKPEQGHMTSAAKIVFWDIKGANNLLEQALQGTFTIGGYIPRVRRNRIKSNAKSINYHSRVLHIEGPSFIVNEVFLSNCFRAYDIEWQNEFVREVSKAHGRTRLEWNFGSYRCQAESARHCIERIKRIKDEKADDFWAWHAVSVHFGVDPCAPPPTCSSATTTLDKPFQSDLVYSLLRALSVGTPVSYTEE